MSALLQQGESYSIEHSALSRSTGCGAEQFDLQARQSCEVCAHIGCNNSHIGQHSAVLQAWQGDDSWLDKGVANRQKDHTSQAPIQVMLVSWTKV